MEFSNIFAVRVKAKENEKKLNHLEIIIAVDWELDAEAADL